MWLKRMTPCAFAPGRNAMQMQQGTKHCSGAGANLLRHVGLRSDQHCCYARFQSRQDGLHRLAPRVLRTHIAVMTVPRVDTTV